MTKHVGDTSVSQISAIDSEMRVVVGITGASGAIYGVRVLAALKALGIETHLIMTESAEVTIRQEMGYGLETVKKLASYTYAPTYLAASIASLSLIHISEPTRPY